jgi:hypothetical protein
LGQRTHDELPEPEVCLARLVYECVAASAQSDEVQIVVVALLAAQLLVVDM